MVRPHQPVFDRDLAANEVDAGDGVVIVTDLFGTVKTGPVEHSIAVGADGTISADGQPVGRVGNTGRSTGPHLHFGLYRDGVTRDPLALYRAQGD